MKVLVTGGTGVIGEGLIPALLRAGHEVRLLTRGAEKDAREWPGGVEPFAADVSEQKSLEGAAEGCGAVVHITGIVKESPPRTTFERVNVGGTKNILKEAKRAAVKRFIFVSSLGADRGESEYHRSKLRAEEFVRKSRLDWVIIRPGNVYGPGDEILSTLLKMIRALPAVPQVGAGDQRFQPIWHEDLGQAIALAVADAKLSQETLEVAGDELTTTRDVIERLGRITDRAPVTVPVPEFLASLGVRAIEALSLDRILSDALNIDFSLNESKLTMLLEENFIREDSRNALTEIFRIKPTRLEEGLRLLADSIPEQLPSEGFGPLRRKRFWADIHHSRYLAPDLLALFRDRVTDVMPIEFSAEPGAPREIKKDATLTASLPLRGHIQMKVAEADDSRITFVTVEGHPLAGVVQFSTETRTGKVRFTVEVHARAANAIDYISMSTIGSVLQDQNWQQVVERMVELSGGSAPEGVQTESRTLNEEEAEAVEKRIESLVVKRKRARKMGGAETTRGGGKTESKKSLKSSATKTVRSTQSAKQSRAPQQAPKNQSAQTAKKSKKRDDDGGAITNAAGAIASVTLNAVRAVTKAAEEVTRPSKKRVNRKKR